MMKSLRGLANAILQDDSDRLLAESDLAQQHMREALRRFESRTQSTTDSSEEGTLVYHKDSVTRNLHDDAIIRTLEGIAEFLCPGKPFDPKTMRALIKAGLPARKLPKIGWAARAGDLRGWCRQTLEKKF